MIAMILHYGDNIAQYTNHIYASLSPPFTIIIRKVVSKAALHFFYHYKYAYSNALAPDTISKISCVTAA